MCDVHPPLSSVALVAPAPAPALAPALPPALNSGLPVGFMSLSDEEYSTFVRQEPIEKFFEIHATPLSTGQWASVYKCRQLTTETEFAAKFCDKSRLGLNATREIMHEMAAMYRCRRCPRIVQLHQLFETEQQYILVMELGSGGDLQGILDNNQVPYEPDVVRFMRNLLEALAFLHERSIAHLDIKPQNLVLTGTFPDCDIKLCDLEISRVISPGQEIREMLGTPDYVSPEILRFDPVTLAADIWSVGVLAYVLLTGFTPFGGDTDSETFRNIARAELEFPDELFEDVSESAKDFIRSCLAKEPGRRSTVHQLLTHRWLQQPSASSPAVQALSPPAISRENLLSVDSCPSNLRRSISKSREVLSVKVSRSNLKKNISKSRERLCDLKFGLPMSPDQLPLSLRASMSKLADGASSRPPWKGAGVRGPTGSLSAAPAERINTFKVRDQYQNQVAATLGGSTTSLDFSPSPFVRHNSLRGRRKSSTQNGESADFRSSLRRNRNRDSAMNRKNSVNAEPKSAQECGIAKEQGIRSQSMEDSSDMILCPANRRNSRKELMLPVEDKPSRVVVDILRNESSKEDEDLRLNRLRTSKHEDDEKENKQSVKTSNSNAPMLQSNSDLSKELMFLKSLSSVSSKAPDSSGNITSRRSSMLNVNAKGDLADVKSLTSSEESLNTIRSTGSDKPRKTSKVTDGITSGKNPRPQRRSVDAHLAKETPDSVPQTRSAPDHSAAEARRDRATRKTGTSTTPPLTRRKTVSSPSTSPPLSRRDSLQRMRRRSDSTCPLRQTALERRNTVATLPAAAAPVTSHRRQASLDKRALGAGAESVRLASVIDEDVVWEQAQTLGPATARGRPAVQPARSPPARRRRDSAEPRPNEPAFDRAAPLRSSRRDSTRQPRGAPHAAGRTSSTEDGRRLRKLSDEDDRPRLRRTSADVDSPRLRRVSTDVNSPRLRRTSTGVDSPRLRRTSTDVDSRRLRKSSTDEDVRRLAGLSNVREEREAPRKPAPFYRRSNSLASDMSSETSSDAGSESYNVLSWEERAEPGRATELRPVVTSRLARQPRGCGQPAAPGRGSLRRSSRPALAVAEQEGDGRPRPSAYSSAVSRAVSRFQALTREARQRKTPAPGPARSESPRERVAAGRTPGLRSV